MDPRHPELAISRMRELMKQYDRIEKDMGKATTSAQLGQLEREGGLVVQEICLVAPRIHEAMMQTSRQRRHDLSHGFVEKPVEKVSEIASEGVLEVIKAAKKNAEVEKPMEGNAGIIGEENIGGESGPVKKSFHRADVITEIEDPYKVEEPKPKKKVARKRATKKADK